MQKFLKPLLLSIALVATSNFAFAKDEKISITIMSPSAVKAALGDFPAAGSAEEAAEVKTLISLQDKRTIEQCDFAQSQNSVSLKSLFVDNNGPLTEKEASQIESATFKDYAQTGLNIYLAKKMYNRPRPYDAHPEVKPCIDHETSMSFPSGHATIARYYANVLSEYFPQRRAAFFKRAAESSANRVIGGVHYPSDVAAGDKFGDTLYALYKQNGKKDHK